MRTLSISATLLSAVSLSACVSASSPPSYESRDSYWSEEILLIVNGDALPNNLTELDNFDPGKNGLVYKGVLHGSNEYDNTIIDTICEPGCEWTGASFRNYIADMTVEIELDNQTAFTGSISNFFTKIPGYETLDGVVQIGGNIGSANVLGDTGVVFSDFFGAGYLEKNGKNVLYMTIVDGGALLASPDGAYAAGFMRNDFEWAPDTPAEGQEASWDAAIFLFRQ